MATITLSGAKDNAAAITYTGQLTDADMDRFLGAQAVLRFPNGVPVDAQGNVTTPAWAVSARAPTVQEIANAVFTHIIDLLTHEATAYYAAQASQAAAQAVAPIVVS